jgi:GTPase SAR1 family protein
MTLLEVYTDFLIKIYNWMKSNIINLIIVYLILFLFYLVFFTQFSTSLLFTISLVFFVPYIILLILYRRKNPDPLKIAIIGSSNAGKTVFITVFFNEFIAKNHNEIDLRPSGEETTQLVLSNYKLLKQSRLQKQKQWLPKTPLNEHFQYSGIVSLQKGLSRKANKVIIEDFAGQFFDDLNETNNVRQTYFTQSIYWKNITHGDAIFFAIDCEDILNAFKERTSENLNITKKILDVDGNIKFAINSIIDQFDSGDSNKKVHTPVAIIFLKFDLLIDIPLPITPFNSPEDLAESVYKDVIVFCKKYCLNFEIFYISSVGHVTSDGLVPEIIEPINIIAPLEWAFKQT